MSTPQFEDKLLKDINPSLVESSKPERLAEPSGRPPIKLTAPATVNRKVACLKAIFNKALANDRAERSPFPGKKVKMLKENNERDRPLSPEEFTRLLAHSSPQIKPIIKLAYLTGMRQGEFSNLTWGQVDLREGFIPLNRSLQTLTKGG
jgi:integrase